VLRFPRCLAVAVPILAVVVFVILSKVVRIIVVKIAGISEPIMNARR
jgi:hypothetical protein